MVSNKTIRELNKKINEQVNNMFDFMKFIGAGYYADGHYYRWVGGRFRIASKDWISKKKKEWENHVRESENKSKSRRN